MIAFFEYFYVIRFFYIKYFNYKYIIIIKIIFYFDKKSNKNYAFRENRDLFLFPQILEFIMVNFLAQHFYTHAVTGKPMSNYVLYSIGTSSEGYINIYDTL